MTITPIDELGKIYGTTYKWKTIEYLGRGRHGTEWLCECVNCATTVAVRGVELRTGRYPRCPNCCRKCGAKRSEVAFRTPLAKVCNNCRTSRIAKWRGKTGFAAKKKSWDKANPAKRRVYQLKAEQKLQSSPSLFLAALLRAKKNQYIRFKNTDDNRTRIKAKQAVKYVVDIDLDYLKLLWEQQAGLCAITSLPMTPTRNRLDTISLDRIDSLLGYVLGNVQLVCRWANMAKGEATNDEFITILDAYRRLG